MRFWKRALPALGWGALPLLLLSYSGGPPVRRTGAPGDRSCLDASCHVGERLEESALIGLDTGSANLTYSPGGPRQRWIISNGDAQARAYGMQLTVRVAADPARMPAGELDSVDATTMVVCENDRIKGAEGCPPSAPIQFLHHTEPRRRGVFELDWTPPSNNLGDLLVYIASNASVSGQRDSRIHLRAYRLTPTASSQALVVNAASFRPTISPGSWISIVGSGLSDTTRLSGATDVADGILPQVMDGVGVRVNGRAAFVGYISPGQVNALAPDDETVGEVRVEITRQTDPVAAGMALLRKFAPALFPPPPRVPVRPGEVVSLHGTGFGPTVPVVPPGRVFKGRLPCASPVTVHIGGARVDVRFAGLVGPGLYELDFVVPEIPDGEHVLEAEIEGFKTDTAVRLAVAR